MNICLIIRRTCSLNEKSILYIQKSLTADLVVNAVDCAGDLLGCAAKVAVGLELHVALVPRLVVHHLHLTAVV